MRTSRFLGLTIAASLLGCSAGEPTSGGAGGRLSASGGVGITDAHGGAATNGGSSTASRGGATNAGGSRDQGGTSANGGETNAGGSPSNGGTPGSGGSPSNGGATNAGGSSSNGGTPGSGGALSSGGTLGNGGSTTSGGASAGRSTTGGASSASGGKSSGGDTGCAGNSFQLLWQDDFDSLNTSRWQFMTHTLGIAQFTAENAQVGGGMATLSLTKAPADSALPYRGVEMRSRETITYGKVESRIRFAAGSAVISSLVLIYTPWPPPDWNEIDIEFFGKSSNQVQFNTMVNIPPADPLTGHSQYPKVATLGFGATSEFHIYSIEWIPGTVRFLVDGVVTHTATEEMARMVLPQNILLTIWASDAADWAGAPSAMTAPTSAQYDWVRVCRYVP